jgi:hypothetical protein
LRLKGKADAKLFVNYEPPAAPLIKVYFDGSLDVLGYFCPEKRQKLFQLMWHGKNLLADTDYLNMATKRDTRRMFSCCVEIYIFWINT